MKTKEQRLEGANIRTNSFVSSVHKISKKGINKSISSSLGSIEVLKNKAVGKRNSFSPKSNVSMRKSLSSTSSSSTSLTSSIKSTTARGVEKAKNVMNKRMSPKQTKKNKKSTTNTIDTIEIELNKEREEEEVLGTNPVHEDDEFLKAESSFEAEEFGTEITIDKSFSDGTVLSQELSESSQVFNAEEEDSNKQDSVEQLESSVKEGSLSSVKNIVGNTTEAITATLPIAFKDSEEGIEINIKGNVNEEKDVINIDESRDEEKLTVIKENIESEVREQDEDKDLNTKAGNQTTTLVRQKSLADVLADEVQVSSEGSIIAKVVIGVTLVATTYMIHGLLKERRK